MAHQTSAIDLWQSGFWMAGSARRITSICHHEPSLSLSPSESIDLVVNDGFLWWMMLLNQSLNRRHRYVQHLPNSAFENQGWIRLPWASILLSSCHTAASFIATSPRSTSVGTWRSSAICRQKVQLGRVRKIQQFRNHQPCKDNIYIYMCVYASYVYASYVYICTGDGSWIRLNKGALTTK